MSLFGYYYCSQYTETSFVMCVDLMTCVPSSSWMTQKNQIINNLSWFKYFLYQKYHIASRGINKNYKNLFKCVCNSLNCLREQFIWLFDCRTGFAYWLNTVAKRAARRWVRRGAVCCLFSFSIIPGIDSPLIYEAHLDTLHTTLTATTKQCIGDRFISHPKSARLGVRFINTSSVITPTWRRQTTGRII